MDVKLFEARDQVLFVVFCKSLGTGYTHQYRLYSPLLNIDLNFDDFGPLSNVIDWIYFLAIRKETRYTNLL